jgi:hypothetical protein
MTTASSTPATESLTTAATRRRAARRLTSTDRYVAVGTWVVAALVYLRTAARTVGAWDIAEMQTVPRLFGVAHPTGYPLFTLLGGVWSRVPLASVAFRMNLLSALLFAGAAAMIVVIVVHLGARAAFGACGGLAFAFAGGTWANANHAEVQSLHVLLLTIVLWRWLVADAAPTRRNIVVMCLVVGIGLTHHGLMLLMAAPLLVWFALRHRRAVFSPRTLATSALAGAAPLSLYAYLPLIAPHARVVNSQPLHGQGWMAVFLGTGFRPSMSGLMPLKHWWHSVSGQFDLVAHWLGPAVLVLAALGLVVLGRRHIGAVVALVAVVVLASYAQANSFDTNNRYLLGPLAMLAVAAAVGADAAGSWLARAVPAAHVQRVRTATVVAAAALPAVLLVTGFSSHDAARDHLDDTNGRAVLAALPSHCLVWSYWDLRSTLEYLHFVDGVRPDVSILDTRVNLVLPDPLTAPTLYDWVQSNPATAGRPVCYVPPPYGLPTSFAGYRLIGLTATAMPWGLARLAPGEVYQVVKTT